MQDVVAPWAIFVDKTAVACEKTIFGAHRGSVACKERCASSAASGLPGMRRNGGISSVTLSLANKT